MPDWFEPADDQIGLFYTAPHAFHLADQLSRTLLGCDVEWLVRLPLQFRHRAIRLGTLGEAWRRAGRSFVKHAVAKTFPAGIYDSRSLVSATSTLRPNTLVYIAEPVEWTREYRCFILEGAVLTLSAYRRDGRIIRDHKDLMNASMGEIRAAEEFAFSVLEATAGDSPPAFVLDVGFIRNRGWAVVEANECWASGIYACDPERVLETLLRACVPSEDLTPEERSWDFRAHYTKACP